MKYLKIFFAVVSITLLTQCTTPYSLYKRGDYYQAVIEAVKKLRSKPDNAKAQTALELAYPMAKQEAERTISNLLRSTNVQKHYSIVQQYENLNRMATEIYRCPKAYQIIPNPREYISELQIAKENAAEEFYQLGKSYLKSGDVQQSRTAMNYFMQANSFIPCYRDVEDMIELARIYSTLRVVVQKPITNRNYQISADFFFDNLMNELRRTTRGKMVEFYSEQEAQNARIYTPHQIITLDFLDFSVGNSRESSKTIDCKKDSVLVGYSEVKGQKYPAYATVKATFTTYTVEILSGGVLNVKVADFNTKRTLRQQQFTGNYSWVTEWATFRGDDRALTERQKALCNRRREVPPPPQTLFVEFTKPIFSKTVDYLNNYYKNY